MDRGWEGAVTQRKLFVARSLVAGALSQLSDYGAEQTLILVREALSSLLDD